MCKTSSELEKKITKAEGKFKKTESPKDWKRLNQLVEKRKGFDK